MYSAPGPAGVLLICRLDESLARNADQTILLVKVVEREGQKCANPTSQNRSRTVKSDYLLYTPLGLRNRPYLCPTSLTSEPSQGVQAIH